MKRGKRLGIKKLKFIVSLLLFTFSLITFSAFIPQTILYADYQNERIISFHSNININPDNTMVVEETIKVYCTGNQIKRGIYRDFPTTYKDNTGNKYIVSFNVLEVTKDGQPEEYRIENESNGKRIYIGKNDVFLQPGEYTYTIKYTTSRQLGFFEDHDELYWNVTGNGWAFLIEKASAKIALPFSVSAESIMLTGYTGIQGSREKAFSSRIESNGDILFETTRKLYANEGLTIVAGWPKNLIKEPSAQEKVKSFIRDNRYISIGLTVLFLAFLY